MRSTRTTLAGAVLAGLAIHATGAPDPGIHFVQVEGERGVVRGSIYVPRDLDPDALAPTLLFLHGYGESGTDGLRNLGVGLPNAIVRNADRWPFIVVMPQKPVFDADWVDFADAALAMLDLAIEDYGADPERVGVTGLSQGGHATIALATQSGERFRAAAPVCGYTTRRFTPDGQRVPFDTPSDQSQIDQAAEAMAGMPVWIFHGAVDDVVPASESESLHRALLDAGAEDVKLTIFPEAGHNAWDGAYRDSDLWKWFADQLAPTD